MPCKEVPRWRAYLLLQKRKVNIYVLEIPSELRRLFASQTDRNAKYFQKHIRYFNSHFSFTSFGVSIDHNLHRQEVLVCIILKHTVRCIIGWISLFLVGDGLAICDYTFITLMRSLHIGSKDHLILILQWSGWFWEFCRTTHMCFNSRILVRCLTLQSTTLNLIQAYPLLIRGDIWVDQVAAIWVSGNDPRQRFSCSIIIYWIAMIY